MNDAKTYAWIIQDPRPVAVGSIVSCSDVMEVPNINRLHIWSEDTSPGWPCTVPAGPRDFRLKYQDGGALGKPDLEAVQQWIYELRHDHSPILVHCGAGQCRSATLALVVIALLRRIHPTEAAQLIYKPLYEQRGVIADIRLAALDSITKWWEGRC